MTQTLWAASHIQHVSPDWSTDLLLYVADEYEVIGEANWQVLETNSQESDELVVTIRGFQKAKLRSLAFHGTCISLCGFPYLFLSYYPKYNRLKFKKCSLKVADYICSKFSFVKFHFHSNFKIKISLRRGNVSSY